MIDPIDLGPLLALHAAASKGKWGVWKGHATVHNLIKEQTASLLRQHPGGIEVCSCEGEDMEATPQAKRNAKAIAALHNAFPAIAAELQSLRALVREAESWAHKDDSLASYAFSAYGDDARLYNGVHALEAENGRLRARVAELERKEPK